MKFIYKNKITRKINQVYRKYFVSDTRYVKKMYRKSMKKNLNLVDPVLFNEKLQWLKIYWRDSLATKCSDKYKVREYVANNIGSKYLIEFYGVYNSFEEIKFDKLPQSFVLKTNHDSGTVLICKDKSKFDFRKAKKKLHSSLKRNFYLYAREWVYKDIEPKIICEKLLENDGKELLDYKFYCFNGVPKYVYIYLERDVKVKTKVYDLDWNEQPFVQKYDKTEKKIKRPEQLEEMIELSKKLSKAFPFVRVDFYVSNGKVFFGELTFFPYAGVGEFLPIEYTYMDNVMGDLLKLPQKNNVSKKGRLT